MTSPNAAIAFGHVSVGVDISRMASAAATMKTRAPASAASGPSTAPPSRQAEPKAASPMAVQRRSAGAATVAKA